jgi:hypothetical protein
VIRAVLLCVTLLMLAARLDLLELDRWPLGRSAAGGWQVLPVGGGDAPSFRVVPDRAPAVHRVSGAGAAGGAHRRLPTAIDPGAGTLRWYWRVLDPVAGADIRSEETDDSPLRVYVVFGGEGRPGDRESWALFYTWGQEEPEDFRAQSHVSDRIWVVRAAGAPDADGRWREQAFQPFSDYREAWKSEPPPITAVGILQDIRGLAWVSVGSK